MNPISESLNQIDWDSELEHSNIDVCVSNVYDKLNAAIEKTVHQMKLTANHFPPWYTAELKQPTLDKKKMHVKSKDLSKPIIDILTEWSSAGYVQSALGSPEPAIGRILRGWKLE